MFCILTGFNTPTFFRVRYLVVVQYYKNNEVMGYTFVIANETTIHRRTNNEEIRNQSKTCLHQIKTEVFGLVLIYIIM